ncbi:Potassium voltage-gated channel subfamily H member 8 [Exaiptasia diaphana]|nr:Potassium voltage-gated channel subfamily H member 8 [Exaiptasia diaphana]
MLFSLVKITHSRFLYIVEERKKGSPFYCLLDIVPIKNEKGNVVLFLVSHKDVTKRKLSNEVHDDESANANGGSQPKLSRTKSRKFSRDVLLHLSRQYQQNNNATKSATTRSFKRSRSFSFTSERLPQYKRESTKKSKFLFLHYSTKKGLWDWWILVLTFYIAIMVPYNVAFSRHGKARDLIIVDMVIELFFILDIVVHFRTTFVNNTGRIVYEQKAIAVHYLKGWFILDFLAALPFEALYFINQSWGFLVQLLKCGRLLRLFRVVRKLHRYTEYSTVLLTLLMLAFAMVAHWLACVWYVIGLEEVSEKSTVSWLYQFGETIQRPYVNFSMDTGPDEGSAYVTSLYFTLTSMTTVGFGNVSANTNAEKAFAVIVMLIGGK